MDVGCFPPAAMALPLTYNLRNVFVRWRATLATIVGVALVVAVYVLVQSLAVGLEKSGSVVLRFAADRAIRLEIDRLACHLGDVGEPWPTPWKPAHPAD